MRVCLCASARTGVCIVLFLDLTACFGSIQSSSSLHDFCPLRDGGMCDLALNDDGNMVRRQEKKKLEERITSPPSPSFFTCCGPFSPRSCYILDFAISIMCITVFFPFFSPLVVFF